MFSLDHELSLLIHVTTTPVTDSLSGLSTLPVLAAAETERFVIGVRWDRVITIWKDVSVAIRPEIVASDDDTEIENIFEAVLQSYTPAVPLPIVRSFGGGGGLKGLISSVTPSARSHPHSVLPSGTTSQAAMTSNASHTQQRPLHEVRHKDDVTAVAYSPPHCVSTGGADGMIINWNINTNGVVSWLDCGHGPIVALLFSTRMRKLISVTARGYIDAVDPKVASFGASFCSPLTGSRRTFVAAHVRALARNTILRSPVDCPPVLDRSL